MAIRMPRRGPAYSAPTSLALSMRECQRSAMPPIYCRGDADLRLPVHRGPPLRAAAELLRRRADRLRSVRQDRPPRVARAGRALQGQGLLLHRLRARRQVRRRGQERVRLLLVVRLELEGLVELVRERIQVGFEELGLQE